MSMNPLLGSAAHKVGLCRIDEANRWDRKAEDNYASFVLDDNGRFLPARQLEGAQIQTTWEVFYVI